MNSPLTNVPMQWIVIDSSGDEEGYFLACSDGSSTDQETPTEGSTRSALVDIKQYEVMKTAYRKVGHNYQLQYDRLAGGID